MHFDCAPPIWQARPTKRHNRRGVPSFHCSPIKALSQPFSLRLQHRSKLGGLVYCMTHRLGETRSSGCRPPATGGPFRGTLMWQSLPSALRELVTKTPPAFSRWSLSSGHDKSATRRSAGLSTPCVQFLLNFVSTLVETLIYEASRQAARPASRAAKPKRNQ